MCRWSNYGAGCGACYMTPCSLNQAHLGIAAVLLQTAVLVQASVLVQAAVLMQAAVLVQAGAPRLTAGSVHATSAAPAPAALAAAELLRASNSTAAYCPWWPTWWRLACCPCTRWDSAPAHCCVKLPPCVPGQLWYLMRPTRRTRPGVCVCGRAGDGRAGGCAGEWAGPTRLTRLTMPDYASPSPSKLTKCNPHTPGVTKCNLHSPGVA